MNKTILLAFILGLLLTFLTGPDREFWFLLGGELCGGLLVIGVHRLGKEE